MVRKRGDPLRIAHIKKNYHIIKMIGLDKLNLSFVHYKKLMKLQFLKYGKT